MATIFRAVALLLCLTVSVLSIGVQAEQTTRTWEARSAVHSFFGGHLVRLTVFEPGVATTASTVVIEFRDGTNRVVATKKAQLLPQSFVQLQLKVADTSALGLLRAVVTVSTAGELTVPLVTFEDINPNLGLVTKVNPPCGPGSAPTDPQLSCQPSCPGWLILTSPQ